MNINSGEAKLVLLCPAWKKWGTARTVKPGTVILHSREDDVVPFGYSEELVRTSGPACKSLSLWGINGIGITHDCLHSQPTPFFACGFVFH
jgi:hypothetical protein